MQHNIIMSWASISSNPWHKSDLKFPKPEPYRAGLRLCFKQQ